MKDYKSLKRILILSFIFVLLFQMKSFGFYTENVIEEIEYTNEYKEWLNLSEEEKQNSVMPRMYEISVYDDTNYYFRNTNLKSSLITSKLMISNYDSYDLRDYINVVVRNQEKTGQCWAFSTNSIIETNIEKTTGQTSPLFSARYAEYATSKTFLDGTNSIAYNREVGYGGFPEIALGLYTSGNGPVLEEDLPFENNENKINLASIQGKKTQKQIKDYERFPSICKTYSNGNVIYKDAAGKIYTDEEVKQIRDKIKEHIIKYGAVASQTYGVGGITGGARKYYNNQEDVMKSNAYFCNNESVMSDHQITIIGWDDNYDVSNFNSNYRPTTPGAYLVLNSWGEDFGENGVYYISYEDYFIEKDILGIISTTDIEYDNIYQHDELGNNYVIATSKNIYGANVFEREDTTKNEWLTEISISSLADSKCDIYINSKDGDLTSTKLEKVASNLELKNGYHTIKLEKPVELTGEKFAIAVKYIIDESGRAYLGLEYPDKYYWKTATSKKGQSYISIDLENWDDLMEMSSTTIIPENANLCIKAFTEYDLVQSDFFEISNYIIDDQYICGISPETKINQLINNISTNMEYYICDENGKNVSGEEMIKTGMELRNKNGTYKIAVKGDVNGDGKITITDVVKVKLHTVSIQKLEQELFKAADVNLDNKVTITDLVIINLTSVNLNKI